MRWRDYEPKIVGIVIIFLYVIVVLFADFSVYADEPPESPQHYRGSNYETWTYPSGDVVWQSAPQYIFDGSEWVPYIFRDLYASEGKYVVQCGLVGAEIYDYYVRLYDPSLTEVRLYDERWEVQRWKNGKWMDVGAQSGTPTFTVVEDEEGLNITKSFHSWAGWLNIVYVFREKLKHTVTFTSEITTDETFRLLQKWAGIVGDRVKHQGGTTTIVESVIIDSAWFEFQKANGALSVLEDQLSAIEYLTPAEIDVHAQGMKCDFTFSSWTLKEGEALLIDPITSTLYVGVGDGYVRSEDDSWDTAHDAESGDAASYQGNTAYVTSLNQTHPDYRVDRLFLPFDTASIQDDAVISAATLKVRCQAQGHNVGTRNYSLVQTTQASMSSLSTADFNQSGAVNNPVEGADRVTITHVGASWDTWTLNATGRGWINVTGWTTLGLRAWLDCDDIAPIYDVEECELLVKTFESTTDKPYMQITYTVPGGPTIGEFDAPSTAYANQYFYLNCSVNDPNGIATFVNATVHLSYSVVLKWDNASDSFSEDADSQGYCTLDTANSLRASVNATAYKLSWRIKLTWTYPEGAVSIREANTKVYDEDGHFGVAAQSNLFTFEDDLRVASASVDPDITSPASPVTVDGILYYQGTSTPPQDTTGITVTVLLSNDVEGTTTTIAADGAFSMAMGAPDQEGMYAYVVYAETDEVSVANQTVELTVSDTGGGGDVDGDQGLGDVIDDLHKRIQIPDWGFWLIIGGLGLVAVAAVFEKAPSRSRTYQPQRRVTQKRRLPKRDEQGRFRRRG